MILTAFANSPAGLFKIYDHGSDWQVVGNGFERWVSTWSQDRDASLKRATALIPAPAQITYLEA